MNISAFILPLVLMAIVLYGAIKKVKVYDCFVQGASGAAGLIIKIFPYLCAMFVLTQLFEASGASEYVCVALKPVMKVLGIPVELTKLMLLKPLSGSGSLALVSQIYEKYGADSYISRCASVIYSSGETIFYVAAIYYAGQKGKGVLLPIVIALVSSLVTCVFACFICLII